MLKVTYVAETTFRSVEASNAIWKRTGGVPDNMDSGVWMDWEGSGSEELSEFSGRVCYESWNRPNPATATTEGYLKHILEVKHHSVLEHGSATVYIEGCSRSCTHELVRHRHFSYSQLSQRFVVLKQSEPWVPDVDFVVPPLFAGDEVAETILMSAWKQACDHYDQLIERGEQLLENTETGSLAARKRAREAARSVLPNMTPTAIVVTGNHRAWRDAILKRATLEADAEISKLFVMIFNELRRWQPHLYQDMHVMNNGERDWVCGCAPGASRGITWHDEREAIADDPGFGNNGWVR